MTALLRGRLSRVRMRVRAVADPRTHTPQRTYMIRSVLFQGSLSLAVAVVDFLSDGYGSKELTLSRERKDESRPVSGTRGERAEDPAPRVNHVRVRAHGDAPRATELPRRVPSCERANRRSGLTCAHRRIAAGAGLR